ncbi:uncharacterized protein V1518DRAFT_425001 [Limtongia smithiae]|uniref:uncharacterized protein n=1 Tax=Limtongia smithiae TaxID=1125753 RepID=UPI0034CE347A
MAPSVLLDILSVVELWISRIFLTLAAICIGPSLVLIAYDLAVYIVRVLASSARHGAGSVVLLSPSPASSSRPSPSPSPLASPPCTPAEPASLTDSALPALPETGAIAIASNSTTASTSSPADVALPSQQQQESRRTSMPSRLALFCERLLLLRRHIPPPQPQALSTQQQPSAVSSAVTSGAARTLFAPALHSRTVPDIETQTLVTTPS